MSKRHGNVTQENKILLFSNGEHGFEFVSVRKICFSSLYLTKT